MPIHINKINAVTASLPCYWGKICTYQAEYLSDSPITANCSELCDSPITANCSAASHNRTNSDKGTPKHSNKKNPLTKEFNYQRRSLERSLLSVGALDIVPPHTYNKSTDLDAFECPQSAEYNCLFSAGPWWAGQSLQEVQGSKAQRASPSHIFTRSHTSGPRQWCRLT